MLCSNLNVFGGFRLVSRKISAGLAERIEEMYALEITQMGIFLENVKGASFTAIDDGIHEPWRVVFGKILKL
ncbi:hypothetical protein L484_008840 [Morus notabilis]|uniref:Uncharacterized protein n=1 Tax=Morus notabilis TaxID=981085 RepID=W9RHC0_9ROSA|nr:hypothetical protein L484_008840 [Morus notabilis]